MGLDLGLIHLEVRESLDARVPGAVVADDEAGVALGVRHQHQRQVAHVHVERVEAEVEEAVDGLLEVLRQRDRGVAARVQRVWRRGQGSRWRIKDIVHNAMENMTPLLPLNTWSRFILRENANFIRRILWQPVII